MNRIFTALVALAVSSSALAFCAAALAAAADPSGRTYLEVSPLDRADLKRLLETVEAAHDGGMPSGDPIVIILHGSEALSFVRAGYQRNQALVDRAAKLDAYQLIDVRMCETWMARNGIQRDDVPAFIDMVPYAPEEIKRLEASGYEPYDTVNL